ncbi:MAG TPA: DUF1207 domain-containing protein [Thermodesulfobacteriota bacterium]
MSRAAAALLLAAACLLASGAGAAGEPVVPDLADRDAVRADCRYLTTEDRPASRGEGRFVPAPFPGDDIFRPLLADPKQPQFYAAYQRLHGRATGETFNAGFVGFGEYFGLWGLRRQGCDGVQVGLTGAVFAQFHLHESSSDLLNADYLVGIPVSFRRGLWSARLRLFHQSSHLGDEFLLGNPGVERVNLSFEAIDALVSVERRWWRLYGGGSVLVNKEPSSLDLFGAQWGLELRGPGFPSPLSGPTLGDVRIAPVLGADFKAFQQQDWAVTASLVGGLEWSGPRSARRLRLLLSYLRGYNPYGQFFDQKIETFGIGLYFAF